MDQASFTSFSNAGFGIFSIQTMQAFAVLAVVRNHMTYVHTLAKLVSMDV